MGLRRALCKLSTERERERGGEGERGGREGERIKKGLRLGRKVKSEEGH